MNSRKYSVLLVCYSYPPVLGGSEIEAQRVCAALIARGHRVLVLTAGGDPMPPLKEWVDPLGVPVRMFAANRQEPWKNRIYALRVAWAILRERHRFDLVYFLMPGLHLAAGMAMARLLGKPGFMKVGGSGILPVLSQSRLGRWVLQSLKLWASRILILNDGMIKEGIAAGFPRQQLMWMPNPVDVNGFCPCNPEERTRLRARLGLPAAARILIYAGRLAPEKALDSLIEGFTIAARRIPESMLVLVGDGPLRTTLEKMTGDARIRFAGRKSPPEVCEWLQASDAFALVSINEGFPCALVEAMAVGLPAVVSDIPANTQLIEHGVHGSVARLGNREAIAESIAAILGQPDRASEMGMRARQRVIENYSTEKIVALYESLFAEVVEKR